MTTTAPSISLAKAFARMTPEQRVEAIKRLPVERAMQLARREHPWWFEGRPDQFAPPGVDWRLWVISAGRGFGKTRSGAEWSKEKGCNYPGCRMALIAPTFTDGRDTMVEGESGILSTIEALTMLRGGSIEDGWNRSMGELYFANGSRGKVFSSEQPWRLRGPQHHFIWGDEPSYWRDAAKGTAKDTTFSNANIGLRLPPRRKWRLPYRPQGVLTMTPRLVPLVKVDAETVRERPEAAGLLQRPDSIVTTGTTWANLDNLDPSYLASVVMPMVGTTLGIQELGGVLLEDVEGALWTRKMIDDDREPCPSVDELYVTVVAFDPAGDEGLTHDEHGIIVASSAGAADWLHAYIRADLSVNATPNAASERVIIAAMTYNARAIVFEKNQGQAWIPAQIRSTFQQMVRDGKIKDGWRLPLLVPVDAKGSKHTRAAPIASRYEQHRVHHVGTFPVLEGQMTTWVPGDSDSPDRLDALVHAVTYLVEQGPSRADVASAARRESRDRARGATTGGRSTLPGVYGYRRG